MGPRAGHLLLEDARAARVGKVFDLGGQVLVRGGNAGVTESMLHGSVSMGHQLPCGTHLLSHQNG